MVETVPLPPSPPPDNIRVNSNKTNFLANTAFYKKIWWKQWMETIAITME